MCRRLSPHQFSFQVDFHLLCGNGTMVFQPTEGNDFSVVGLSALTQAMVEERMVALVRKVYRKGTNPRLGILVPEDDASNRRVLVYIQTPYMDDLRHFQVRWDKSGRGPSTKDTLNPFTHIYLRLTEKVPWLG